MSSLPVNQSFSALKQAQDTIANREALAAAGSTAGYVAGGIGATAELASMLAPEGSTASNVLDYGSGVAQTGVGVGLTLSGNPIQGVPMILQGVGDIVGTAKSQKAEKE